MYIVSGNYRDRGSIYKWLVRLATEPVATAKAFQKIIADGVTFRKSNEESGFGCSVVAECTSVECFGPEASESLEKIYFNGHWFEDQSGATLNSVKHLELREDGSMAAELIKV